MKETLRLGLFELSSSGNNTSITLVDMDKEERIKKKRSLKKKLKKKIQRNTHKK